MESSIKATDVGEAHGIRCVRKSLELSPQYIFLNFLLICLLSCFLKCLLKCLLKFLICFPRSNSTAGLEDYIFTILEEILMTNMTWEK